MAAKKSAPETKPRAKSASRTVTKVTIKKASDKAKKTPECTQKSAAHWTAPLRIIGRYFAGAWHEGRQVRWPNARATWSMTSAVIIFSAIFATLILGLDYVFQLIFTEVLL